MCCASQRELPGGTHIGPIGVQFIMEISETLEQGQHTGIEQAQSQMLSRTCMDFLWLLYKLSSNLMA